MAKVKGRDIVIEVMEAVEALQATQKRHTEQLEELATISMQTVANVAALSGTLVTLVTTVGVLTQRVGALETDVRRLSEGFVAAAEISRSQGQQLGRLGRLLGQLAEGSQGRFEQIEARLDDLERAG